jgi:hypothetical protein
MIRAGFASGDKQPDRDELKHGVLRTTQSRDREALLRLRAKVR